MFTKESKRIVATENSSEGSIKFILKVSSQLTLWISKITFFAFDTLCPPCVLPIYRNSLTTSNLSQLFCQLFFFLVINLIKGHQITFYYVDISFKSKILSGFLGSSLMAPTAQKWKSQENPNKLISCLE